MHQYDIILVLGFFRRLTYYLSIIKYLAKDYNIGLYPVPLDNSLKKKHKTTQDDFIKACINMGAHLADEVPISAKIAIYPQEPYLKEAYEHMTENLSASLRIGALTLGWPGLHDDFIKELNIEKVFVVHKAFFEFLLQNRGDRSVYDKCEITETGLPYKKYPLFTEFRADYLLAIPTPFSFSHQRDKWGFLETVISLLQKIDKSATIAYKPHNAQDRDYFSDTRYRKLARHLAILPDSIVGIILKKMAHSQSNGTANRFGRLYTAYLFEKIMNRVVPLEKITSNNNYALEAFLPGVARGVIGGLSNTIWGTLFSKLPFYNCVDINRQDRNTKDTLYKKDPSRLLDLNLKFFHVPYCKGELNFDSSYFDIVQKSTRQGDMIEEIRNEMNKLAVSS